MEAPIAILFSLERGLPWMGAPFSKTFFLGMEAPLEWRLLLVKLFSLVWGLPWFGGSIAMDAHFSKTY